MKKIVAAFDGLKYSRSTQEYAIDLVKKSQDSLVGVFLEDFTYHSYKVFDMVGSQGVSPEKVKALMENDVQTRKQAVLSFNEACKREGITNQIHHDKSLAIQELLKETIYGDLLIISSEETLSHTQEKAPTRFIRDLLVNIQCPVLIVPPEYKKIDRVVLLYDGDPSSVFAAKMFSYMLPDLNALPIEVVSVKTNEEQRTFFEERLIKEFIRCHFPKAGYKLLEGDPESQIVSHLKGSKQNVLVVLGAYRRTMVSRWFKPSMADVLMEQTELPLFVAHYK